MQSFGGRFVISFKKGNRKMNLTCAILHRDSKTMEKLEEYIGKVPFLTLCGTFARPLEALKEYYETKVDLYFVGIYPVEEGEIDGMDFCRLLSASTRVIFITDTERYAVECFRLDALDYLMGDIDFSVFFQSVSKATRWFSLQEAGTQTPNLLSSHEEQPRVMYIRADNRIMRLDLDSVSYIEGLGDYVKIHIKGASKPVLSLCSMKYMEKRLPANEFIRIHRSFIVRMDRISAIGRSAVEVEHKDVPIGDAYRDRIKGYVSGLMVL